MKKRLISFLLAIAISVSMFVFPVHAALNSWEKTDSMLQNVINAALAQKGKKNIDFNKADGMPRDQWCAYFIIWLGRETGASNAGIFPKKYSGYGTTGTLAEFILDKNKGKITCFHDESYNYIVGRTNSANVSKAKITSFTPQPGDLIFFRSSGKFAHHVGLVYKVTSSKIYYVDGNGSYDTAQHSFSSSYVDTNEVKRNHFQIAAYLRPNYGSGSVEVPTTKITYCRYRVTVPANYKLQCYQYPESTAKYKVINPQSSSYNITCTRKVDLSYGGTRYFFVSGDGYELYFDYVSGMSVTTLHDYTTSYVSATCTSQGYTRKTCTCGYVNDSNFYGPLEHDWVTWIPGNGPTCTEGSTDMVICSNCSTFGNREVPPTGHNWVEATCTAPRSCTNCGATEGAALGHDLQNWTVTVYPTCTQEGQETASCTRCGETQSRAISVTGHKWIEATCVSPKTCTECGMTMSGALGHQYVSGTCVRCGEKDESGLLGDVNGDGNINNIDAMQILQYAVGIVQAKDLNLACGDVNGDGAVNNVDAMLVLQYAVGLIKHF